MEGYKSMLFLLQRLHLMITDDSFTQAMKLMVGAYEVLSII